MTEHETDIKCSLEQYGKSPSARVAEIGSLEIYFSYGTPIAFLGSDGKLVVSENRWGSTTGRHIASLGVAKPDRMPSEQFDVELRMHIRNMLREV